MNAPPVIAAWGRVDREGIAGSSGVCTRFSALGVDAPGDGRTFRAVFGERDETFRRLDRASRALVLAGAAAGIRRVLAPDLAANAALVFETTVGSLDADLRFADSMAAGMCDGPVFAYTLPSSSLGELALRHGLRGPTVCLVTGAAERGAAWREAVLMLEAGDVEVVVAGVVDVLAAERPSAAPVCHAVVTVLARATLGLPAVAPWPDPTAAPWDSGPWSATPAAADVRSPPSR